MKINNNFAVNQNNKNIKFKGCDVSQITKDIVKNHVEWANLMYSPEKLMTNIEIEGKANKIWNEILKIYDKYKNDKKIKVVISGFKDGFGEQQKGIIQARVGLENSNHSDKVSCNVNNDDFPLLGLVDREAKGYNYPANY